MLESLSNGFTGLQTIRLASLLKRDPSMFCYVLLSVKLIVLHHGHISNLL